MNLGLRCGDKGLALNEIRMEIVRRRIIKKNFSNRNMETGSKKLLIRPSCEKKKLKLLPKHQYKGMTSRCFEID